MTRVKQIYLGEREYYLQYVSSVSETNFEEHYDMNWRGNNEIPMYHDWNYDFKVNQNDLEYLDINYNEILGYVRTLLRILNKLDKKSNATLDNIAKLAIVSPKIFMSCLSQHVIDNNLNIIIVYNDNILRHIIVHNYTLKDGVYYCRYDKHYPASEILYSTNVISGAANMYKNIKEYLKLLYEVEEIWGIE